MKLTSKVQDALNRQINNEMTASYSYLGMAVYFEARSLPGFAAWFRAQSAEEAAHAMKILDHVIRRDGEVVLADIAAPGHKFQSVADVIATALAQEEQVSADILALHELASSEGDIGTRNLMEWYVIEQEEEEDNFRTLRDDIDAVGEDGWKLLEYDKRLTRPAAGAAEDGTAA
jgi:ferritin